MTVLDRRYVRFAKDCDINKLEKYFNIQSTENINKNFSLEKIDSKNYRLKVKYFYYPKCPERFFIQELPYEINKKIIGYLDTHINISFVIKHPNEYPFENPILFLEDLSHNLNKLNMKKYYQNVVNEINKTYSKEWVCGIQLDKYILEVITRINNFDIFHKKL